MGRFAGRSRIDILQMSRNSKVWTALAVNVRIWHGNYNEFYDTSKPMSSERSAEKWLGGRLACPCAADTGRCSKGSALKGLIRAINSTC